MSSEREARNHTRHIELTHPLHAYMSDKGTRQSTCLQELRAATIKETGKVWGMMVPPEQAAFLGFLAQLIQAKRVLEIGTFTGYGTLALAENLPEDGTIVTCDVSDEWTSIGVPFWERDASVRQKIDLRLAPAIQTLDALLEEGKAGTFDLVFIDADKTNYDGYYERSLLLLRPGGLVVVDNVLWNGWVIDDFATDPETLAVRALNTKIHADRRVAISMLPVGDGITLAVKLQLRSDPPPPPPQGN